MDEDLPPTTGARRVCSGLWPRAALWTECLRWLGLLPTEVAVAEGWAVTEGGMKVPRSGGEGGM